MTLAFDRLRRGAELSIAQRQRSRNIGAQIQESRTPRRHSNPFGRAFEDPNLTRLIQQAIESNYDLKIAGERIRAAHDAVRVAAAGDRPQIGIGAAAESRRETQTIDWPPASPKYGEYPYYSLGFNASWELDLFGETRRRKESAQAAADAAVETRRDILISLTAAVASNYLSIRATELRLQIARDNLDIARQTQKLAHRAFESGERSHLDVSEADGRVHGVEASIPPLQAHLEELTHALAILLAQAPAEFMTGELHNDAAMLPSPPLVAAIASFRGHRSAPRYPEGGTRVCAVERQRRGCGRRSISALLHSFEHRSNLQPGTRIVSNCESVVAHGSRWYSEPLLREGDSRRTWMRRARIRRPRYFRMNRLC